MSAYEYFSESTGKEVNVTERIDQEVFLPGSSQEVDKPQGPHHLLEVTNRLQLNQICLSWTWAKVPGETL